MSAREILEIPQNESINLLIDNAVRVGGAEPTGTIQIDANGLYNVAPYAAANVNVPQGIVPTGTIQIDTNGLYNVTNYAGANVNVPEPSGSISITQNGTIDVKDYASANVNVPQGVFPTGSLSITQNGTYDVTNYAGANVNVSGGSLPGYMDIHEITPDQDTATLTVSYDNTKTIGAVFCYNTDFSDHTASSAISSFAQLEAGSESTYTRYSSYTSGGGAVVFSNQYGGISIDSENSTITISNRSGFNYRQNKTYRVIIIYTI